MVGRHELARDVLRPLAMFAGYTVDPINVGKKFSLAGCQPTLGKVLAKQWGDFIFEAAPNLLVAFAKEICMSRHEGKSVIRRELRKDVLKSGERFDREPITVIFNGRHAWPNIDKRESTPNS